MPAAGPSVMTAGAGQGRQTLQRKGAAPPAGPKRTVVDAGVCTQGPTDTPLGDTMTGMHVPPPTARGRPHPHVDVWACGHVGLSATRPGS